VNFPSPLPLLAPFFPSYASQFGIDTPTVGWIFGVYPLASFFTGIFSLSFLRYFGRVKVLAMGGFLTSLGTLAFCYSNNALYFILSRVAQGVGCGLVNASCSALTSAAFEDRDLAFVFALFEAILGIAYALGPGLGALIYSIGGFQVPFLCSALLSFAVTIMTPPVLRRHLKKKLLEKEAAGTVASAQGNVGGASHEDDSESTSSSGAFDGIYDLYWKCVNAGFGLSCLNMIVNALVWALVEPLLENHFNGK
jgi:MFS family permease